MAKTKQKGHSSTENLRGYIRELEKTVRSLQKQVRQYEKYEARPPQDEEYVKDSEDTHPDLEFVLTKDCEYCGPGKGKVIQTLEIMGKIYGRCNCCGTNDRIR